jgi:hypothetical protein
LASDLEESLLLHFYVFTSGISIAISNYEKNEKKKYKVQLSRYGDMKRMSGAYRQLAVHTQVSPPWRWVAIARKR